MDITLEMIKNTLGMFLFLGIELSVLFILISAGVSLLQQYISNEKIQSVLGASKGRGYILAAGLGAITPFCSCSTIPMLRGLLKAKAGFGVTLTFLFTSPLLNPIIIGLFLVTFKLKITIIYAIIALVVSIVAGMVLSLLGFEKYIIPEGNSSKDSDCSSCGDSKLEETTTSCCSAKPVEPTSCCDVPKPITNTFLDKVKFAFKDGYKQFKDIFVYLLLGVSLGAVVYGFVPSEFIAKYASGDSIFAVPIAAVIGIPLYIRVEALIPLSSVLIDKGMGLGAIMALIIGGGGASLTELVLLKSMFKTQMMVAFVAVIITMAIIAGYVMQYVF